MSFRITGLDPAPFRPFYGGSTEALRAAGVIRLPVEADGYPDRVELRDARPGETVLLLNFTHQPAATPYRASHAIFVREGAETAYDAIDTVPEALLRRTLSLRGFDAEGMLVEADLAEGRDLAAAVERLFADPAIVDLHAHHARQGCYAARIVRA